MHGDLKGIIISYVYLLSVLFMSDYIRRRTKWPAEFTRKCVHIGVGLWGLIAFFIFEFWWAVLIPPVSFVFVNALSHKYVIFKAMETDDKSNLGTVYYPFSLSLLIVLFWRIGDAASPLAGLMAMAMGDGFAAIIGKKTGRHFYKAGGAIRSLEGSAAMFLFSAFGIAVTLLLITQLNGAQIVFRAMVLASLAALLEAVSPKGLDNLIVPITVGIFYHVIFV